MGSFNRNFVFMLVSTFSLFAQAGDLSALKDCVEKGYNALTSRHAIGAAVLDADNFQAMTFGSAKENQIFEIGSITKTFTANLLAQSVGAGIIKLSDPIPAKYQKQNGPITYQQLTTHTSGIIAGIFPDFKITNPLSPFDGLTIPVFKTQYAQTPLAAEPGTAWSYSNIGMSLLGLILAEKSGSTYEEQVQTKILKILGMNDSYFEIPASELARFPNGRMIDPDGNMQEMPHWDLYKTAIDPAGGLRSTVSDMVKYAQANLAPKNSPLATSIELSQKQIYFIKDHNMWIGMNWIVQPDAGLIWHNGETFGFNSILVISSKTHQAIVAMTDTVVATKDSQAQTSFDTSLQDIAFACLK